VTQRTGRFPALLLRLLAGLVLLALAIALAGPARLFAQLRGADPSWFAAAAGCALAAQWVSVQRWRQIARVFRLRAPTADLALAYAQGMTVNAVLPGATLGGDALRALRLQRLGNPLAESALTVAIDRLSGLWVLCLLSLVVSLLLAAIVPRESWEPLLTARFGPAVAAVAPWLYLAGLFAACALPALPIPDRLARASEGAGPLRRLVGALARMHQLALAERGPLARSLWLSILVQGLSAATLWLCLRAAGGGAGYWQVQAVAAPVFIAGALPLSYGGFGARELVALLAFPLVGVPPEQGIAASVLYGLVGIVLGILVSPSLAFARGRAGTPSAR